MATPAIYIFTRSAFLPLLGVVVVLSFIVYVPGWIATTATPTFALSASVDGSLYLNRILDAWILPMSIGQDTAIKKIASVSLNNETRRRRERD